MAEYWTDEEISKEYAVGPSRLFSFAQRGNLAMRVQDGERFYDVEMVAKLFRRRDAAENSGMVLGGFRLGEVLEDTRTRHSTARVRQSVRVPMTQALAPVLPLRKLGVA